MKRTAIYLLLMLTVSVATQAQTATSCPTMTNQGNDFWVTFFYNYHETESYNPGQLTVTCVSDQNNTVTITGASNTHTLSLNAGNNYCHSQTLGNNSNLPVATVYNGGYHITSTQDLWLYSCNYVRSTQDIATIIPSDALDTTYLVQDYPAWQYGAQVAFVATEDSTILTMTVPCAIQGTSITAGTTLTPMLMQGQSYLLISQNDNSSFSGMRVTSNGKPFAMFQGGRRVKVPHSGSGSDLLYEQTLPENLWGDEFIVAGAWAQGSNSYVRITSSEDNCTVTVDGTLISTLNAGETYEFSMPTSAVRHIVTSKPSCVILYLTSYINGGNNGDPSSVSIPPVNRGVCESRFLSHTTTDIGNNSHYLIVVCDTAWDGGMMLDYNILATNGTTLNDRYRVYKIQLLGDQYNSGVHHLTNTDGPFIAYTYGLGHYESYAFPLGFRLNVGPEDTIDYSDTVCQNHSYNGYGFTIESAATDNEGDMVFWRNGYSGDTVHHYRLTLTVLPSAFSDTTATVFEGDSLLFIDTTLSTAGNYEFLFTAANGCDSVVRLHLIVMARPLSIDTTEYLDTVCQNTTYNGYGFSVSAFLAGTHEYWRSDTVGDSIHCYHLFLTVLAESIHDTVASIIVGDTLFFNGDTLTQAGTYLYQFTAANGCDSLLTLHLNYEAVGLTASAEGLCPGDSATLTASGVHYAWWTASPPDTCLTSQQGMTSVTVSPSQTTAYSLCAYAGGAALATVTIGVEAPPTLCVSMSRPFIDFDFPVVVFDDCSEGSSHSTWSFSDSVVIEKASARRQFHHPLPDSVEVTLQSCNRWNCCTDTTFSVPSLIRSVWFPNVFTPGEESNNRFGITASFEIKEFELYIYNRQGLLIYHTDDPAALWDGTLGGRPCPQGAYVYRWHVRDAVDYYKSGTGTITLLR